MADYLASPSTNGSRISASRFSCYAVVAPGLEDLVAAELGGLGIRGEAEAGGVAFRAGARELYQASLHLRVASRILVRVAEFRATAFWELEKRARAIPWDEWVGPARAVTFRVTARKSKLYHQDGIAERLAGAITAAVSGVRATDEDDAQEFVVRLFRDTVTLSIDSSGALLHQRGYRHAGGKAPLRENLGAAMLQASAWNPARPLLDPFAGSGTIPIEAALLARRIPPGWRRGFAFERWPGFDASVWSEVRGEAESRILPRAPAPIRGSDRDAGAVAAARSNAERAGVGDDIEWTQAAISSVVPPETAGWLVANPPYGVRVGEAGALRDLYARLGQLMRKEFGDWTVALLAADQRLLGATGARFTEVLRFRNGGIPVGLALRIPGVSE